MTSSGIKPATFRFVAEHRNHCAPAVTGTILKLILISVICYTIFFNILHISALFFKTSYEMFRLIEFV